MIIYKTASVFKWNSQNYDKWSLLVVGLRPGIQKFIS